MNEKKKINKSHKKYDEYISKCRKIAEAEDAEISEMRKSRAGVLVLDGPETAIRKKYWQKVKELQKEYSFLFEE